MPHTYKRGDKLTGKALRDRVKRVFDETDNTSWLAQLYDAREVQRIVEVVMGSHSVNEEARYCRKAAKAAAGR